MARPIKNIKFNDYFSTKPTDYNRLQKGMIASFSYEGDNAHDKTPLVYILEVRRDRVYGFNLRYKPTLFNDIRKAKQLGIDRLIASKIKELTVRGVSKEILESYELKKTISEDIPKQYYEYFEIDIKPNTAKYMLRNYLPSKLSNLKYIIFRPTI